MIRKQSTATTWRMSWTLTTAVVRAAAGSCVGRIAPRCATVSAQLGVDIDKGIVSHFTALNRFPSVFPLKTFRASGTTADVECPSQEKLSRRCRHRCRPDHPLCHLFLHSPSVAPFCMQSDRCDSDTKMTVKQSQFLHAKENACKGNSRARQKLWVHPHKLREHLRKLREHPRKLREHPRPCPSLLPLTFRKRRLFCPLVLESDGYSAP